MKLPTYANVAGGGPAGERCRTCAHIRGVERDRRAPNRAASPWCAEALRQARSRAERGGGIDPDTSACRSWRAKPKPGQPAVATVDQPRGRPGGELVEP